MREFIKGLIILGLLTSAIAAAIAWIEDRPGEVAWMLRIGGPAVALGCFVLFLLIHFQRDRVPDFLYEAFGGYLDRGGFCFAFDAIVEDDVCYVRAHFQNRYSRPCRGRIALRPARGFFLSRSAFQHIAFDIDCPAAGFGVAQVPVPVGRDFQGKKQTFEVGASVHYPHGRGRMLRFRDGGVIRTNSKFGNPFGTALTAVGALSGSIVWSKPATFRFVLPPGVAEELPPDAAPDVQILWQSDTNHEVDMEPTVCPHCGTRVPAEAGGHCPACGSAPAGLGDNPYASPSEGAAATGGAGGMTVAEKIYSAFVLLWAGFVLVSLASFHFMMIPHTEDPAPLYFVVSLLWIICLSLAVTTAWNLYHRSLLVIPTVLQCAIQALMVYFIPFAIWGGVLLYRRLQREKSRAGPERPEFNIHRPPTNP